MDLASWLRFFVGAVVGLTISLAISSVVDLVIGEAILMEANVAIGFFKLFLW